MTNICGCCFPPLVCPAFAEGCVWGGARLALWFEMWAYCPWCLDLAVQPRYILQLSLCNRRSHVQLKIWLLDLDWLSYIINCFLLAQQVRPKNYFIKALVIHVAMSTGNTWICLNVSFYIVRVKREHILQVLKCSFLSPLKFNSFQRMNLMGLDASSHLADDHTEVLQAFT